MNLVDTHCHIHDPEYNFDIDAILANARAAGIGAIMTVGTSLADSARAVRFAEKYDEVYVQIGIHPGVEGDQNPDEIEMIIPTSKKIIGLGDIGLDYHYKPFNRDAQINLFERQLQIAVDNDLSATFHVREAFDDFWPILDNFPQIRGTLHSYTDNVANMEQGLSRGLYISVNGIVTFNREPELAAVYKQLPLHRVLFETDAPYLAPKPHRGGMNEPAYAADIARFWAKLRGLSLDEVVETTTNNAKKLFNLV